MEVNELNTQQKNKKQHNSKNILSIIIILLLLLLIGFVIYFGFFRTETKTDQLAIDSTQSSYVEPEIPIDRSKNVTLPGWGAFTIPANKQKITQGFEYHNPEENMWYVDTISINGNDLEDLVVDSGVKTTLNHYLKLADVKGTVKSVKDYDKNLFKVSKNDEGEFELEATAPLEKTSKIVVETTKNKEITLDVSGKADCYYMTFALYLSDGDECLYQSGLVAPGKYIQEMDMNRSLKKGSYDAYVVVQPYRSDKKTKTNSGVVNIKLNVQ